MPGRGDQEERRGRAEVMLLRTAEVSRQLATGEGGGFRVRKPRVLGKAYLERKYVQSTPLEDEKRKYTFLSPPPPE